MNKTFEIWSEGFELHGNIAHATLHGTIEAENFEEACNSMFVGDHLYNAEERTLWGCKLFDNEKDARKAFG